MKATLILALCATSMAPATSAQADETIAKGNFSGQSGHATTGGVSVRKTQGGTVVVLAPDFSFDGAPDPKLGFGPCGRTAASRATRSRPRSIPGTTTRSGFGASNMRCLLAGPP
jgi:hypothetical protein